MATISNTPRPAYAWDSTDNVWYPIGTGAHDHNQIPKSVVTTKGDLIVGTGAGTVVRQGVGADGSVLVADSTQTDGLNWAGTMQYAGKNKYINGDFSIWQRGTTFNSITTNTYTADRTLAWYDGSGSTRNITRQTFTPGSAPVAGYESPYFIRYSQTVAGTGSTYNNFGQRMEDVRTFAGQTVTFSFWAKAAASTTVTAYAGQEFFGSSSDVYTQLGSWSVTTSWARYTGTVTIPSLSGKTIGSTSQFAAYFALPNNATFTLDFWGIQLEAGSVATPFVLAGGGSQQAELALCQRYYNVIASGASKFIGPCYGYGTSRVDGVINFPYMRTAPTLVVASGTNWYVNAGASGGSFNSFTGYYASNSCIGWYSGTSTTQALGYGGSCYTNNASASVALDAEL